MKVLIIFTLTIISFNSFAGSATVGQDLKGECKYGNQEPRKSIPKVKPAEVQPVAPVKEEKKEGAKAV